MSRDTKTLYTDPALAASYAQHRPTYPSVAFDLLAEFARANGVPLGVCADIATGTGQAAAGLAHLFREVIAVDASPAQVAAGAANSPAPNISFRVGTAEATGLEDQSVDAVIVAEALHWFDIPAFYAEVARILRPGGVIAVLGYAKAFISNNPAADSALKAFEANVLGPFMHPNAAIVLEHRYRGVEPPAPMFEGVIRHESLPMSKRMGVDDVVGLVQSWSSYGTLVSQRGVARGSQEDPATAFRDTLREAAAGEDGDVFVMEWPCFLVVGRRAK